MARVAAKILHLIRAFHEIESPYNSRQGMQSEEGPVNKQKRRGAPRNASGITHSAPDQHQMELPLAMRTATMFAFPQRPPRPQGDDALRRLLDFAARLPG